MNENLVYTVKEAAQILRISEQHAYDLCSEGRLPCAKVGRHIRIPRQKLMEFLGIKEEKEARV